LCSMEDIGVSDAHQNAAHSGDSPSETHRVSEDAEDAVFLVDYARHLATALRRAGFRFQTVRHGNRNAVERVFREIKRRTPSFSSSFSHVQPTTAETWLQAFAVWWNSCN